MGDMATKQTASMEDYLEAIVILDEEDKPVSVTEIAKALGVTKPSVTSAWPNSVRLAWCDMRSTGK